MRRLGLDNADSFVDGYSTTEVGSFVDGYSTTGADSFVDGYSNTEIGSFVDGSTTAVAPPGGYSRAGGWRCLRQ